MHDDPASPDGVKGHVVSMQSEGWSNGRPVQSVAVCECGWSNTVSWGGHEAQDRAISAHWKAQAGDPSPAPLASVPLAKEQHKCS